MRTTIELPDELFDRAKSQAALAGMALKEFFIEALEQKLAPAKKKVRRPPPSIGHPSSPRLKVLTPEQLDEAMFG